MKKIILSLILSLFIMNCSSSYGEEKNEKPEEKIPVRTTLLTPQNYIKKYDGTGKVIASKQANLMFEVPGKIVEVNAKIGDIVEKGEILAKLNDEVYKAKFELAKSAHDKAKRDYKNIQDLYKKNAVSEDQLLNAELGLKNANSDYIAAKYAFENTALIAPFKGTITHINLNEGELFSPGPFPIPPVIISNLNQLQLEAIVSSKEISSLKIGQEVRISQPLKNSNKQFEGLVSEVGYVPITMSNSYKLKIDINENNSSLKLGMMMNFTVELAQVDSVYMLSNRYILDDKSGSYIWMNDNSTAKKVNVETGDLVGHEIIVSGDLYPGMMVVTDGNRQVKSGSILKVVK